MVALRLYLVQHGEARAADEDPERPLTDTGTQDVDRVARWGVEHLGVRPARVVHSGKTRARQTAEVWAGLLEADPEHGDALAPNDDPSTWIERVDATVDDLMLVGHLPHLDRLSESLVTGSSDRSVIGFRPGGLVGLERTEGGWTISIVLPPQG